MKQRGYNIVEGLIVITVATLLASAFIGDYVEWQTNRQNKAAERAIELIKDALAAYAYSNRTVGFRFINNAGGGGADPHEYWSVPSGRPYLPCPDITGDGREDRRPVSIANQRHQANDGSFVSLIGAECYRYKGVVPWRTLGTPPADPWGNQYTYRVDPDYTFSVLGFDNNTRADDYSDFFLAAPPLSITVISGRDQVRRTGLAPPDANLSVPAIDVPPWGGDMENERSPSIICAAAPCGYETPMSLIVMGIVAEAPLTVSGGGYGARNLIVHSVFQPGNIVSGLPAVILSHGKNGYGAMIYADGALRCHSFPDIGVNLDEQQNAYRTQGAGGCAAVIEPGGAASKQYGFVSRQRTAPDSPAGEFDDIVGWLTAEELSDKLAKSGIFPVEPIPAVGLEGY